MKFRDDVAKGGDGNLLLLKPGTSVEGILVGDPHEYEWAFKPEDPLRFRFRINFATIENNAIVLKIFEGGPGLYADLRELAKSGWDLPKTKIKISREGSGLATKWSVIALPQPVQPGALATIASLRTHDLPASIKSTPAPVGPLYPEPGDPGMSEQDIPF